MTQILRGLSGGLSNIARGVATASEDWPEASAVQARLNQQRSQLEEQALAADKERRRKAAQNLFQFALKSNKPELLKQALDSMKETGGLPPETEFSPEDLESFFAKKPEFKPLAGTEGGYTMVDGQPVYQGIQGYPVEEIPDEVQTYDRDNGIIIYKSGKHEFLDSEFRTAIENQRNKNPAAKINTVDKDRGLVYIDNGDGTVSTQQVELPKKAGGAPIKTHDLYDRLIGGVTSGTISTDAAYDQAYNGLLERGLSPEEAEKKTLQWSNDFLKYKFKMKFSEKEDAELRNADNIAMLADQLILMLDEDNPKNVRDKVGRLQGWWKRTTRLLTGGYHDDKETIDFLSTLAQFKDALIIRARTGATVRGDEQSMYDEMIGSDVQDEDALVVKLKSAINFANTARRAVWRQAFTAKGQTFTEADLDEVPQYRPKNLGEFKKSGLRKGLTAEQILHRQ